MRNLKKILALVLALVMSLSLMATASAGTFEDVPNDSPYKTATDVLNGLKVFKGYQDGSFQPEKTITRAEVATIIYRIATADVDDTQNKIYTTWNKFSDVKDTDWYAGYVNYCANAEYVKGNPDGTFAPQSNVTGYAVLAMILRAMGWDRNHEFEGKDWQIQTAAIARQEGLLDGVTNASEAQLGQPAPRGMVAQILFNALLTSKVDYTVLGGYQHNGKTLGQEQFGLEYLKGIVMANQWAALDDDAVMAVDTTRMTVTAVQDAGSTAKVGDTVTLDSATDLDAVGMAYVAYVAGKTAEKQTLTLAADPINNVGFNEGKAINTNVSDQGYTELKKLGVALNDKTEYYIDYDQNWTNDAVSDFLIRYVVTVQNIIDAYDNRWISLDVKDAWLKFLKDNAVVTQGTTASPIEYTRTIRPETAITETDQAIMKEIFYSADRYIDSINAPFYYIKGEVFVGTASTKDVSDTMSWVQFKDEYFNDSKTYVKFSTAQNGESVRTIDNNGDGVAEYALKITYTMDRVVGTYKDALLLNTQAFANYSAEKNTLVAPELEQGDVVVYSKIDGQLHVRLADSDTDVVKTKDWKNVTVTTAGGETYGQSGISNKTSMDEVITQMNENTEYVMYKDLFNFVRAYELAQGSKYALVTEVYPTGTMNWNYVKTNTLVAEIKVGEDDVAEHNVANPNTTPFVSGYAWTTRANLYSNTGYNFLQPAIAHLDRLTGVNKGQFMGATNTKGSTLNTSYTDWTRTVLQMVNAAEAGNTSIVSYAQTGNFGVFNYGQVSGKYYANNTATPVMNSSSFTNVAAYTMSGDNVALDTAAKLFVTKEGEQMYYDSTTVGYAKTTQSRWVAAYLAANYTNPTQADIDTVNKLFLDKVNGTNNSGLHTSLTFDLYPVFKTDYIQLDKQDIAANTVHYSIDKSYGTNYNTAENVYVDATVDTEYYIVMPGSIMYKVGFAELPTIKAGEIRAAYAVANNTAADSDAQDYWVADVIVIEVNKLAYDYDSISLMYYNTSETTGYTRYVDSLNNQWRTYQAESALKAKMEVIPAYTGVNGAIVTWGNTPWNIGNDYTDSDYGFYKLYRTENPAEGQLTAVEIEKINDKWNSWGIYAGEIYRTEGIVGSGYIDVDMSATATPKYDKIWVGKYAADVPIYRIETNYLNRVTGASELVVNPVKDYSEIQVGDQLIWVYEKGSSKLAYIVDLGWRWPTTVAAANQTLTNIAKASYTAPAWLYDYDGTSVTDSLYEVILNSQGQVATGATVNLTIKCYDGAVFLGDIAIPMVVGNTVTLTEAQIEAALANMAPGYELDATATDLFTNAGMTTTLTGTWTQGGTFGTNATWAVGVVTSPLTVNPVYAKCTKATYSVATVSKDPSGITATADSGSLLINGNTVAGALPVANAGKYGDIFTFDITIDPTNYKNYTAEATAGVKAGTFGYSFPSATKMRVTGTVVGNVTVTVKAETIQKVALQTAMTVETDATAIVFDDTNLTNAATSTTPAPVTGAPVPTNTEVKFTVTPKTANLAVYGVEFKCSGFATEVVKKTANNKYTVPADMLKAPGTVTITALFYDTDTAVTVGGAISLIAPMTNTGAGLEWNGTPFADAEDPSDISGIKPGPDAKIRITSLVPITVNVTSQAYGIDAPSVTSVNGELAYEITGIYGDFDLNIAQKSEMVVINNKSGVDAGYTITDLSGNVVKSGTVVATSGSVSIPAVAGQTIQLNTTNTAAKTVTVTAGLEINGNADLKDVNPVSITVSTGGIVEIPA